MRKAFEYCLERVGAAAGAGPLWSQYCALLQRPRAGTTDFAALFGAPPPGQEEAARSAAVRCAESWAAEPSSRTAALPQMCGRLRVMFGFVGLGVPKLGCW